MSIKNQFTSKTDETIERFSLSPIGKGFLDGGLSLIPFFGPAITSALSTRAVKFVEENSKRFAEELRQHVRNLDHAKLDKDFIESDEFTSLLLEILSNFAKTHEQEKIKLFAKLFANSALKVNSKTPYKEGFVRIVSNLATDHMILFSLIYDKCKHFTEEDREQLRDHVSLEDLVGLVEIPKHRILAYCQEMITFGLIYSWGFNTIGTPGGAYALAEYGKEFAKFLNGLE